MGLHTKVEAGGLLRAMVYVAGGLAAWIGLVAIPTRTNPNVTGRLYFAVILVVAFVFGAVWPSRHHARVSALLVLPGLALAGWTAPRGDNDGLWGLWFVFLLLAIVLGSICHRAAAALRRG